MLVLVTGATGVVGSEVCALLKGRGHEVVEVSRHPVRGSVVWDMGRVPPPRALLRRWDAIIHTAASTRWTMTRAEAITANIGPTRAVLELSAPETVLVHVSTAYAGDPDPTLREWEGYRNGYEWSKARCERLVLSRAGATTRIVRPPLVLGRSADGTIGRFAGPYTLLQALVSGLAAAIVGDPDGYAEVAPLDQVADTIVDAAVAPHTTAPIEVIAAGPKCLRLKEIVAVILDTCNAWRVAEGLSAIATPPTISYDRWHRFYLPLAAEHLSPMQNEVVRLLGMFEAYTSMRAPFTPTRQVADPAGVVARSVAHWMAAKPRLARNTPSPWTLVAGK